MASPIWATLEKLNFFICFSLRRWSHPLLSEFKESQRQRASSTKPLVSAHLSIGERFRTPSFLVSDGDSLASSWGGVLRLKVNPKLRDFVLPPHGAPRPGDRALEAANASSHGIVMVKSTVLWKHAKGSIYVCRVSE